MGSEITFTDHIRLCYARKWCLFDCLSSACDINLWKWWLFPCMAPVYFSLDVRSWCRKMSTTYTYTLLFIMTYHQSAICRQHGLVCGLSGIEATLSSSGENYTVALSQGFINIATHHQVPHPLGQLWGMRESSLSSDSKINLANTLATDLWDFFLAKCMPVNSAQVWPHAAWLSDATFASELILAHSQKSSWLSSNTGGPKCTLN